jgi:hypothetical protein
MLNVEARNWPYVKCQQQMKSAIQHSVNKITTDRLISVGLVPTQIPGLFSYKWIFIAIVMAVNTVTTNTV